MVMIHGKHFRKDEGLLDGHNAAAKTDEVADEVKKEVQNIKNNDNLSKTEKDNLRDQLRTVKKKLETTGKPRKNYNDALDILKRAKQARRQASQIADGRQAGEADTTTQANGATDVKKLEAPEMSLDSDGVELEGADDTGKSSGASGDVEKALEQFDVQKTADMMMENPEAAFDKINDMPFKAAQQAMTQLQMYMQQTQRMTKMMSNLSSMAHKTENAVIRNIG